MNVPNAIWHGRAIAICILSEMGLGSFSRKNGGLVGGTVPAEKNFMSRLYLSPEDSLRTSGAKKPLSEKIGALTFHLYLQNGCPEGREKDFWRRARKIVQKRVAVDTSPSGTAAAGG